MGDHGDEWDFQRIGTQSEKSSVDKELAELRPETRFVVPLGVGAHLEEIEAELNRVWVEAKDGEGDEESQELAPPPYLEREEEDYAINQDDGGQEEAVQSGSEDTSASI